MQEALKKKYSLFRIIRGDKGEGSLKSIGKIRVALEMSSDRRDKSDDNLCLYLKKTYKGVCDKCNVMDGDIIKIENGYLRVISVKDAITEQYLHIEEVKILDTGAFDVEVSDV